MRIMKYFALMRVKHYIKNLIIFLPAMLTLSLKNWQILAANVKGFIIFSLSASIIYIFNDIKDFESDRKHPLKSSRPIASGKVSFSEAKFIIFLLVCAIIALLWSESFRAKYILWPLIYIIINILYSAYLKNFPLIDVAALSSCYVIRLWYGAALTECGISNWMSLTMISVSFFMGFGKRRNELIQYGKSMRKSLKGYSANFLDKSLQIMLTSSIIFYSLMCADEKTFVARAGINLLWTVPFVIVICLRYLMLVENAASDGDPTSIILHDKILIILCFGYIFSVGARLYFV